jgi:hypothetical protein
MSSSAEPRFNSRSRARVLIADMDRYYVDRHFVSTRTRVWSCYSSAMARDFPLLVAFAGGVCRWTQGVDFLEQPPDEVPTRESMGHQRARASRGSRPTRRCLSSTGIRQAPEAPIGAFYNAQGRPSSLGARGCAPPAPELAHRPHDAHVRDVQIALSDFELGVPEQQLDLTDVEAVLEPS